MRSPIAAAVLSLALLTLVLSAGCRKPPPPDPNEQAPASWFEDVTDKLGIDFVHDAGPIDGKHPMPQIVGSGCALFDFDGDGRLDVYLLNNGGPKGRPNRLYRQKPDGTFEDVSAGSGLDVAGYCMGVAVGDVDGDGLPDVLLTEYGRVRLFRNLGGGKFQDVTTDAGLENPAWGASAAFVDYDRDGKLDLVIINYVDYDPSWKCTSPAGAPDYCNPGVFAGRVSRLYRNLGGWKFQDVSLKSKLGTVAGPGLGVVCADFDGDGWPDIFVANDGKPNHLWINQKDGTFKEEAVARGVAFNGMGNAQAGMGVALGDVDGDGLFDLFVTHLGAEQHTLWKQGPRGLFRDRSGQAGLTTPRWRGTGFGVCLADLDNDGALDAVLINGRVSKLPPIAKRLPGDPHWHPYLDRNQCFANTGKGQFRDRSDSEPALCGGPNVGRGLAYGDVDGDGGIDLLVTSIAGRARLLRNVAPERGHWLLVRALDAAGKRDLLGAELSVTASGRTWTRTVRSADSYLSASDSRAHFGLGTAERVDRIDARWPDGTRERFAGGPVDRVQVLRQGTGEPIQ
jgi:enediyne biosynthesis protein E4